MPDKAKSKAQYRFLRAIQSGSAHAAGLSKEKAKEMLGHQSPKGLPERKSPPRSLRKIKS